MSMLEMFELPVIGAVTPELALFALSVVFFGFSTGLCAMAVRAANGARDAQDDARVMMRTVQDYAVEVRQHAAQAEKFALSSGGDPDGLSERIQSVRVGSRYDTEEAQVDVENGSSSVIQEDAADQVETDAISEETDDDMDFIDEEANARLADATLAATEPRSLLSGMLRRR